MPNKKFKEEDKMIINHNLSALNAWRALSVNTANTQKVLEKLSSGYRINRAGDDAAGLAISEKMRAQIAGLNQAQRNAQDGISLIQTAEGALNETQAILQRMRELAVQAANDTNTADDRAAIQKEIDQLAQEIARIGKDTEFNTQKLLDGNFKDTSFQIGANQNQNITLTINDMRSYALGVAGDAKFKETVTPSGTTDFKDGTYTVKGTDLLDSNGNVVATTADGGKTWTSGTASETLTFSGIVANGETITIASGKASAMVSVTNDGLEAGTYTYDATKHALKDAAGNIVATDSANSGIFVNASGKTVLTLVDSPADGTTITVGGIDVSSKTSANSAITTIDQAIQDVSAERAKLGAYQNRLEHTINNLGTASENLTAAESRIRDVDMAQAMMEFTKNNILNQAATAMLERMAA
jgi:flagellin